MRWFKCDLCQNLYEKPILAILCCVKKQSEISWTTQYHVGDIVYIKELFFENNHDIKNNYCVAGSIFRNNLEFFQYYYVVVGVGSSKLYIYNGISDNPIICGGYIEKRYSRLVKNVTAHLEKKYSSNLFKELLDESIHLSMDIYIKLMKQNLIHNEYSLYDL